MRFIFTFNSGLRTRQMKLSLTHHPLVSSVLALNDNLSTLMKLQNVWLPPSQKEMMLT